MTGGEPKFLDGTLDTLLNPTLIIEVLSPSTEKVDRVHKYKYYTSIPSLIHYMLIASDRMHVELFTRQGSQWVYAAASQSEDFIEIPAINCRLTVSDLYRKVVFTSSEE
ncbi:MAG TPA: Uma2 family endonuclease [Candidatus Solibacter sp.]|nr:Uma2 family endonuclease [Candidatus Solibacter sp.]